VVSEATRNSLRGCKFLYLKAPYHGHALNAAKQLTSLSHVMGPMLKNSEKEGLAGVTYKQVVYNLSL
jgi:hypothetical protein